jgi:hypothetical protein
MEDGQCHIVRKVCWIGNISAAIFGKYVIQGVGLFGSSSQEELLGSKRGKRAIKGYASEKVTTVSNPSRNFYSLCGTLTGIMSLKMRKMKIFFHHLLSYME